MPPSLDHIVTLAPELIDLRYPASPLQHFRSVVEGTVKYWSDDEGWGVLISPAVPGEVWIHFSCIVGSGYRSLTEGDAVRFSTEQYPPGQDGYYWRAIRVVRISEGSEFANLNDVQIEARIKEIDDKAEAEAALAPDAYSIEEHLEMLDIEDGAS